MTISQSVVTTCNKHSLFHLCGLHRTKYPKNVLDKKKFFFTKKFFLRTQAGPTDWLELTRLLPDQTPSDSSRLESLKTPSRVSSRRVWSATLLITDAMTERCKSIYATMHQNVARVIYQDFIMKMNLYIVVRNVMSQGDKILAKKTIRCK